jgi:hypothetical protein
MCLWEPTTVRAIRSANTAALYVLLRALFFCSRVYYSGQLLNHVTKMATCRPAGVLAVHVGAGYFKESSISHLKEVCSKACTKVC